MPRSYAVKRRSYKEGAVLTGIKTSFAVVSDGRAVLRLWFTSKYKVDENSLIDAAKICASNLKDMDGWSNDGKFDVLRRQPMAMEIEFKMQGHRHIEEPSVMCFRCGSPVPSDNAVFNPSNGKPYCPSCAISQIFQQDA